MEEIMKVDTVEQYNELFGFQTRHPQVGMVDFDKPESQGNYRMTVGFYGIFLKETKGCIINYGKSSYDFDDKTVVSFAPGQTVGYTRIGGMLPKSVGLLFHPDFIRGHRSDRKSSDTPFSLTRRTRPFISLRTNVWSYTTGLAIIRTELQHAIDRHTKGLICTNIELLLDYCMRFYERQFVTRQDMNLDVLGRFEKLIDEYLDSDITLKDGVPSVQYFADKVCLSPNYFGDLVKKETGKSAKEYIQLKMLNVAKEELLHPEKSITEVAAKLGFQYPQHFVRFFKRYEGITPSQYRQAN